MTALQAPLSAPHLVNTLYIQEPRGCLPSRPGPALGPELMEEKWGPVCWAPWWVGVEGLVGWLLASSCAAAPSSRSLPQAEDAGNWEVVAVLQHLQTVADNLAPQPVSPPCRLNAPSRGSQPWGWTPARGISPRASCWKRPSPSCVWGMCSVVGADHVGRRRGQSGRAS